MSTFVIGDVHGRRAQLQRLLGMLPFDHARGDTLVLLGDLVDRGEDVPGTVADVIALRRSLPFESMYVLRGNHEQMLLDFVDDGARLWLHPAVGGDCTFEQYTGRTLADGEPQDIDAARAELLRALPEDHLAFFRRRPLFHEDAFAIYVHAGLDTVKHPRECDSHQLLWSRNQEFFKNYRGKPCVFGHTPTQFLPRMGRIGRHGIYICHSAVGIDTGFDDRSPLSCLQLPEFNLYQTFPDGRTAFHHISHFLPEPLRAFRNAVSSQ